MNELPAWDAIEAWIDVEFVELANRISRACRKARSTTGRMKTEVFPLTATMSFSRAGLAGEEDAVVSVSGEVQSGILFLSADVSRGDGLVLAAGPTMAVSLVDAQDDLRKRVEPWLGQLAGFLRIQVPDILIRELG